jgi:hypothetical protein
MGLVPPCFDTYVWVEPADRAATLRAFIDAYVDEVRSDEPHFEAFVRTYVEGVPAPDDRAVLAELWRGDGEQVDDGFSIYLRARGHFDATMTLTREGAVVLGLSLDDPGNSPRVWKRGEKLGKILMAEFGAPAAMGGVEVPPPQSRQEWEGEKRTEFRIGALAS